MVADAIMRSKQESFTLVGHSLGGRVIYYALQALATRRDIKIHDVILLGAAVGRKDDAGWRTAQTAITGKIYNCYSSNDGVLRYLYQFLNLKFSDPAGLRPITYPGRKIENVDCSDLVGSHLKWKNHYGEILEMIC
jgi:pimeloyl-ACP methyl ester carboxylesterase